MIRVIAAAAVLGTLFGSIAINSRNLADWRAGLPFGGRDPGTAAAITPEAWPICSSMTSVTAEADWAQLDPDFEAGKKALVAEDWNGAIAAFELAALRDPLNADTQNYIGYAYRRLRQLGPAMGDYQKALMLNQDTAARMSTLARRISCWRACQSRATPYRARKSLSHSLRRIR